MLLLTMAGQKGGERDILVNSRKSWRRVFVVLCRNTLYACLEGKHIVCMLGRFHERGSLSLYLVWEI